jgi:hypothetical protein
MEIANPVPENKYKNRREIIVYIEYQSVCLHVPSSELGPSLQASVSPSLGPKEGRSNTPLQWVVNGGDPIRTTGKKGWLSVYSVIELKIWSFYKR